MTTIRTLLAALLVASAGVAAVVACKSDPAPSAAPAPPPPTAPGAHEVNVGKLGMNVNYLPEVANNVAEEGIFQYPKTYTDATAALPEQPVGQLGPGAFNIPVSSCYFHTNSALTSSTFNFAFLSVYKRTYNPADAGDTQVLIAQANTQPTTQGDGSTGNWNAWQNIYIPPISGAYFSPNDGITFSIAAADAGVTVPAGELACYTTIN